MKISYKLALNAALNGEFSRENSARVCEEILNSLREFEVIEIDLHNVNFTPSVADEVIGGLAQHLGPEVFKKRIKILNASNTQMVLMRHVIARRLSSQGGGKAAN